LPQFMRNPSARGRIKLSYQELMHREREFRCSWNERDVMIYALELGFPW